MRRTNVRIVTAIAVGVIVAGVVAGVVATQERTAGGLPGVLTGPAPWGANVGRLRDRLEALGLRTASGAFEPLVHLSLVVRGRRVSVPAGIGDGIAPLRTRTPGVVEVASGNRSLTLGDLFGVWGVRFTPECLGGYCADGRSRVRVYVNGARVPGDARRLPLIGRQEILVAYGPGSTPPAQG